MIAEKKYKSLTELKIEASSAKKILNELIKERGFEFVSQTLMTSFGEILRERHKVSNSHSKFPSWFKDKKFPGQYIFTHNLADHVFVYENNDFGKVIVMNPYSIDENGVKELVEVCKKLNLEFSISGASNYFPGRTVSIQVWEK